MTGSFWSARTHRRRLTTMSITWVSSVSRARDDRCRHPAEDAGRLSVGQLGRYPAQESGW
jgi:hypothetical protein